MSRELTRRRERVAHPSAGSLKVGMPLSRDMPAPVNATTLVDAARTSATSSMLARHVVFFGPQSDEVKAPICLAKGNLSHFNTTSQLLFHNAPGHARARAVGHHGSVPELVLVRHLPGLLAQGDPPARVHGAPVKSGPMQRRKPLQVAQRASSLEGGRVQRQRRVGAEDACAAARALLRVPRMRRAVGAQEEAGVAAGGGSSNSGAVGGGEHMRLEAASLHDW